MTNCADSKLIRFPNRLASIADIVAHNTLILCRLRNQTPESLAKLANLSKQYVDDVLDPVNRAAKLFAVFSIARALKVSPETILGFDNSEVVVRRN